MSKSVKKEEIEGAEKPTSFKLSKEAKYLLKELSKKTLRSQAKTLEFLIIEEAKKQGIK